MNVFQLIIVQLRDIVISMGTGLNLSESTLRRGVVCGPRFGECSSDVEKVVDPGTINRQKDGMAEVCFPSRDPTGLGTFLAALEVDIPMLMIRDEMESQCREAIEGNPDSAGRAIHVGIGGHVFNAG